jgi:hypothetical protein
VVSRRRERAEELAELLDGTRAPEDADADLRQLASLATTVAANVTAPALDDATRDRLRTRILAEVHTDLEAADAPATDRPTRRRRAALGLAGGVASAVIGAAGVAVAAQGALPGDLLYDVKQATETVRVAAASDATEQGRLELALAEERLAEVVAAVERGGVRDAALVDTLARMDTRARDGAVTLVGVAEREDEPALLDEVAAFTERQAGGLTDVFGDLPVTVRPHAEDSLALLRAIREQLLDPAARGEPSTSASYVTELERRLRSDRLPPAEGGAEAEGDAEVEGGGTSTTTTTTTTTRRSGGSDGDVPASGGTSTGGTGDDGRTVVPRLPGPLDEAGGTVDDTVDDVVEGSGGVVEGTRRGVDDAVDGTRDTVGDVGGDVDDVVDDVVDGLGDAVEGTLDGAGGPLRGGRDGG